MTRQPHYPFVVDGVVAVGFVVNRIPLSLSYDEPSTRVRRLRQGSSLDRVAERQRYYLLKRYCCTCYR